MLSIEKSALSYYFLLRCTVLSPLLDSSGLSSESGRFFVAFLRGECFLAPSNVTFGFFRIEVGGDDGVVWCRRRLVPALDMLELPTDSESSFKEFVFNFFRNLTGFLFDESVCFSGLLCPDFAFLAPDRLGFDVWFLASPEDFFRIDFFDFWALD